MVQSKTFTFFFFFLLCGFLSEDIFAQIDLKRDDFVGNSIRNWWDTRNDNVPLPVYNDSYISFKMINPDEDNTPWSDCEIFDGYPNPGGTWNNVTITQRVKMLNTHRDGSHGWGLWYSEWPVDKQNQIFFMRDRDKDDPGASNFLNMEWFRADISNGRCESNHSFTELDDGNAPDIDDTVWHTYTLTRDVDGLGTRYVEMLVDGVQVFYDDDPNAVPDELLAYHIWIDNFIYDPQNNVPTCDINTYRRGWTGESEMVMDFVQILPAGQTLGSSETPSGIKRKREISNEIFDGSTETLWKQYSFDSPASGNYIFLITGRVEQYIHATYGAISDDDDMRLIIDGTDYGWGTANSFNADVDGTVTKTLLIEQAITTGTGKSLDVYGDITPFLYDVTVLGSAGGGIIYDNEFNETRSSGSGLWKTIEFQTDGGEVAIYVSGSADEDPNPSRYGYQYSDFDDSNDDDLKLELNGTIDYEYWTNDSFWGNRLFGEPKSVLIIENLSSGSHTLRIYSTGTPTLNRVLIYGENDDDSLPITLQSFTAKPFPDKNIVFWKTASEINNMGFNIYRAFSNSDKEKVSGLNFEKLNESVIPGAGSSSIAHEYKFVDVDINNAKYFWYVLEDISFEGNRTQSDTINIDRSEFFQTSRFPNKLLLSQNFPNPFNPSTHIQFTIPKSDIIKIEIFDINGQAIKKLTDQKFSAGEHTVVWNGKDNKNNPVSSGIYYYRLQSKLVSTIKKMTLIR